MDVRKTQAEKATHRHSSHRKRSAHQAREEAANCKYQDNPMECRKSRSASGLARPRSRTRTGRTAACCPPVVRLAAAAAPGSAAPARNAGQIVTTRGTHAGRPARLRRPARRRRRPPPAPAAARLRGAPPGAAAHHAAAASPPPSQWLPVAVCPPAGRCPRGLAAPPRGADRRHGWLAFAAVRACRDHHQQQG